MAADSRTPEEACRVREIMPAATGLRFLPAQPHGYDQRVGVLNRGQGMRPPLNLGRRRALHLTLYQLVRTQVSERVLFVENHWPTELQLGFSQLIF